MMRVQRTVYLVVALMVACGTGNDGYNAKTSSSSSDANGQSSSSGSVVLKSEKSVSSTVVSGQNPINSSSAFSFSSSEVTVHQGGMSEVEVTVQGKSASGSVTVTPPTLTGFKVELLDSAGAALAGPVTLDAQGRGKFKLRVNSEIMRTAEKVVAPGPQSATLQLRAVDAGNQLEGALPVKVSNVAMIVMSNVAAVRELPPRFEIPAGTIPIFFNPPTTAVVGVMHFAGGGAGAAAFRHQNTGVNMPANMGYCPLNNETRTLVAAGAVVSPNCLPCPADAAADVTGTFYDHNRETSGVQRTLVCLKK